MYCVSPALCKKIVFYQCTQEVRVLTSPTHSHSRQPPSALPTGFRVLRPYFRTCRVLSRCNAEHLSVKVKSMSPGAPGPTCVQPDPAVWLNEDVRCQCLQDCNDALPSSAAVSAVTAILVSTSVTSNLVSKFCDISQTPTSRDSFPSLCPYSWGSHPVTIFGRWTCGVLGCPLHHPGPCSSLTVRKQLPSWLSLLVRCRSFLGKVTQAQPETPLLSVCTQPVALFLQMSAFAPRPKSPSRRAGHQTRMCPSS